MDIVKGHIINYKEPYNGIFPHHDLLFITSLSTDKLIITQFQNNKFKEKIAHQIKNLNISHYFHDYVIIGNRFLLFPVSEERMYIYSFSDQGLKPVNEVPVKIRLFPKQIQKISDKLIVSCFNDILTFWEMTQDGEKLYMNEKYKITVPTTNWKQIKSIEYNEITERLIVIDEMNHSFLYKPKIQLYRNFDKRLNEIFFKFQ